jgi:nucleotide-binding universal stress UspA family protein
MSIFPTKILLATDGSEEATLAARTAVDLAKKTGSELHVVHARPLPASAGYPAAERPTTGEIDEEAMKKRFRRLLDEQVKKVEAEGSSVAQAHLRLGRPDTEIVGLAEEIGAGLVVTGSRGLGGMRRALMGSVSDSVVRHAHCPVLVVREENQEASDPAEVGLV